MHPSFFSNYNTENITSKHYQVHYNPHYIPLEDQPIVRSLFQQQKPCTNDHNHQPSLIVPHENSNINVQSNMKKSGYDSTHVVLEDKCIPSKRSSKKDRHSKINTARGPRDRRMRLSLDVAKKFFRLQDMLGFDKASSTIEWLIMKSKPAIRDLVSQHSNQSCSLIGGGGGGGVLNSASSGSECEVLSGIDDQFLDKTGDQDQVSVVDNAKFGSCRSNKEKKKVDRGARKSLYIDHTLAKETREKARARARKRTSEKRYGASCDQYTRPSLDKVIDQNTNRLGSWIPFGENQVHTTDQPEYPSSGIQFKQGFAGENSSVMSNNWMPSLFNYHNNPGSSHEHQFSDFQIQGKPWAGIHN